MSNSPLRRTARAALKALNMDRTRCRACSRPTDSSDGLCAACRKALPAMERGYCPSCGRPARDPESAPVVCKACAAASRPWARLWFHGPHEGLLRDLILGWKFHGRLGLTGLLGDLAAHSVRSVPDAYDLIVPVPLHPSRLLKRGFNQSMELSRIIARRLEIPLEPQGLKRTRATAVQSLMKDVKERRVNIRGAFTADSSRVRGARIILVDDVLTTGATLEECALTLLESGAEAVDGAVVSRAVSS